MLISLMFQSWPPLSWFCFEGSPGGSLCSRCLSWLVKAAKILEERYERTVNFCRLLCDGEIVVPVSLLTWALDVCRVFSMTAKLQCCRMGHVQNNSHCRHSSLTEMAHRYARADGVFPVSQLCRGMPNTAS